MKSSNYKGLIAAPFTPMKDDCSVNLPMIGTYAERLKKDGIIGVFVCGTTGEGMLMTDEERRAVAEEWTKYKSDNFRVIVHVGSTSARQSAHLATHAMEIGADAIGCMGPSFLPPTSVDGLLPFCEEVASAAPEIPFFYYHIPSISGVKVSMVEFLQKAKENIPNLAGIKFTDNDFMEMMQCLQLDGGKWEILHGYDELLLGGLTFGAKGAVGSTYNYVAPLYQEIINAYELGDMTGAREKQLLSMKMVKVLIKYGGALASGKALMKYKGVDCGLCRAPLKSISESAYQALVKELEQLGVFGE